jgi:hypothetical protein
MRLWLTVRLGICLWLISGFIALHRQEKFSRETSCTGVIWKIEGRLVECTLGKYAVVVWSRFYSKLLFFFFYYIGCWVVSNCRVRIVNRESRLAGLFACDRAIERWLWIPGRMTIGREVEACWLIHLFASHKSHTALVLSPPLPPFRAVYPVCDFDPLMYPFGPPHFFGSYKYSLWKCFMVSEC